MRDTTTETSLRETAPETISLAAAKEKETDMTQEAQRTTDKRAHDAAVEGADTAHSRRGQSDALASPPSAGDADRERNPWLVTATLLARDALAPEERQTLIQILDTVLTDTQPVRLRGWLKLLGDTRLHRGWTAYVPRAQLVRLIRHAAVALPDAPQEPLQDIESTDAPLRVATELYATFSSARRHSTTAPSITAPTVQRAATDMPQVTSAIERPHSTGDMQLRDRNRELDVAQATEGHEQNARRDTEAKHETGSARGAERQPGLATERDAEEKPEITSTRDAEDQPKVSGQRQADDTRQASSERNVEDTRGTSRKHAAAEDKHEPASQREADATRATDDTRAQSNIREPETARPIPHPDVDINAIEALHETVLDLARALAEPGLSGAAQVQLKRITDAILNQRDAGLLREWRKVFTSMRLQQGLVRHVPAHVLERLLRQLAPDVWPMLDASSSLVVQALGLLVADARSHAIEQAKWQFLFERAFTAGASRADADLLTELAQVLAVAAGLDDSARLLQLIERRRLALAAPRQAAQSLATSSADTLSFPGYDQEQSAPDEDLSRDVHVDNVGLVLVAPFIPRLFSMLNVTANGNFPDHAAAERGVHLLQYLVTGQEFTPEYRLLLNKVMCGILPAFPVCAGIDVSPQEKDAIEQLLQSIIQHWKILGSTSIAGLRQTFLQREGWLRQDENGWHVEVKPGSFDMLLDQLPWSYSLIKFTWMDKPMHVTWRNKQTQ
ncbi:MAG: contractile injection system tape measure protein [Pseudomonadota bacterium]|nr:contractile injection system tape measure protein [Pseudomonadota bacterium]